MTARKYLKGFTLIELLIVIAVLGVIAAGVVVAINPAKRIRQANDAKIKNDVGQIATALQAYYTTGTPTAFYPSSLGDLETSQDLKKLPVAPTGSAYVLAVTPSGCTTALKTCTEASVEAALLDATGFVWCWMSSIGTASQVTSASCIP